MDIYEATNFLDSLDLIIDDAIIIDDTATHLKAAADATSDGTDLIQTDYPTDDLVAAAENGVTVYAPAEETAYRVYSINEYEPVTAASPATKPEHVTIPVDAYNRIEAQIHSTYPD